MKSLLSVLKPRSVRLLLSFTGAAFIALLLCIGSISYLLYRDWQDEQRDTLIQDVLWLEQSIRVSLDGERYWAQNMASSLAGVERGAVHLANARALFLREHPDVVELGLVAAAKLTDKERVAPEMDALWRAARLGHAAYGEPYLGQDGRYRFDLAVALPGKPNQFLRLVYQFDRLLQSQVPWWMAERYHISLVDVGGKLIASKFSQYEPQGTLSHQLSFDPPGFGLSLRAVSYRQSLGVTLPVLMGVIILLALALAGAFWRIRRYTGERVQAERVLSSEISLRQAMEDGMKNGLLVFDPGGRIVYVNRAFCRMTAFVPEQLPGMMPPYPFWGGEAPVDLLAMLKDFGSDGWPEHGLELQLQTPQGNVVEVRVYVTPLGDGGGGQCGWIASMYDITELKRQRLAMVASRERFLAVLNGLETGLCVSAGQGLTLLYSNPAFTRLWPLAGEGSYCVLLPGLPLLAGSEGQLIEYGPDASGHYFELQHSRIEWSDGEQAWLTRLRDVTEARLRDERERALEVRFQTTTRLVAMGEMASSLAHELGQPLTAINTYASGLKRRLAGVESLPDGVTPALQALADQAQRAGQIVGSIRAFVKRHTPQLQEVDPRVLMPHALSLAQPLADKHLVPLRLTQLGRPCALQLDPVLIEQVMLNLVKNAIEAQVEAGVSRPRVDVRAESGVSSWRVEVQDNGPGLSEAAYANLFTPFYSSKADGMGIGLNICRSIIEFHRGEFGVTRTLAGGCVFWFTLPLSGEKHALPDATSGRAFQA